MTISSLTGDDLERWVLFGAQWRVLHLSHDRAVVDLCTTGELVERRESGDPVLLDYRRTADSNTETKANTRTNR